MRLKTITIGSMIIASLALSACAPEVPSDKNRVAAPVSSSAPKEIQDDKDYTDAEKPTTAPIVPKNATEKDIPTDIPTADPKIAEDILKQEAEKPLNVDIEDAIKNHSDASVEEIFPKKDFDIAAGVRFGLATYQDLVQTKNFYDPRDASKDMELIAPYLDKFDQSVHKKIEENIAENGRYQGIPTADSDGVFGKMGDGTIIDPVDIPSSTWGTPSLVVQYNSAVGDYLQIVGQRRLTIISENEKRYEAIVEYKVGVVPAGESWLVSEMLWKLVSLEEVV